MGESCPEMEIMDGEGAGDLPAGRHGDGLPLAKLPEWKSVTEPIKAPRPPRDRCQVTKFTSVNVQYGEYGSLNIFLSDWSNPAWPTEGDDAQQRLATLEFVAAEMDQALPIVHKMIQQAKGEL